MLVVVVVFYRKRKFPTDGVCKRRDTAANGGARDCVQFS